MKFKQFQQHLFIMTLFLVTLLFLWLIKAYLLAIFWAAVLAIIFYPTKKIFLKLINGHEVLSTLMTMLLMFVVVFVPLYVLGIAIVSESVSLYRSAVVSPQTIVSSIETINEHVPVLSWLDRLGVDQQEMKQKVSDGLRSAGLAVASGARSVGSKTFSFVINFFIMLYVLYFFIRHGTGLLRYLQKLIPLGDKKEERLFYRFSSTVRATVKGTLIIGVLQGILGGTLFWLVGIGAPVLWGALMAVLSIIPAIGSFIIWGPAGIILLAQGNLWEGVAVLVIGALVISMMDNVLRPPLVGKDTQMPDAMILLSTLGGLTIFGITGFVIGPVIAAFFLSLWKMFEEEYSEDLQRSG